MMRDFTQVFINLSEGSPTGYLKISKLMTILDHHPSKDEIFKTVEIETYKSDIIAVANVDTAFNAVLNEHLRYEKINVVADTKHVEINSHLVDEELAILFKFQQCRQDDELKEDIVAEAIYNSKNSFFEDYSMSKYANYLFDKRLPELVEQNVSYFKTLAENNDTYNKKKSYRLLCKDGKYYVRGITSEVYKEYGIDFAFFVTILLLHKKMKNRDGHNYKLVNLYLNESKLDMIIKDQRIINIEHFGRVSLAIHISTNELGDASFNIKSVVRVENDADNTLVYLYPNEDKYKIEKAVINHRTGLTNALEKLKEFDKFFDALEQFVEDIQNIRTIKTPDELRHKIREKIVHPLSIFKKVTELQDIFSNKITNEINQLSSLLEMCRKAEELDLNFDMKGKLRYMISNIILDGNEE